MSEHLVSENDRGWDEARIERVLFASGQRVSPLSEQRREAMLRALLAESARLATVAHAQPQTQTLGFWDLVRQVFTPRVVGAIAATCLVILGAAGYALFGGTRPPVVAQVEGAFTLAEARQGVFGLQWRLPRSHVMASSLHIGDEVFATAPVTITFADGSQAVVAAGSQVRILPSPGFRLVKGEAVASTTPATDRFVVESIGATFVVTDATFRVKVDETGTVSQFTDLGKVVAQTSAGPPTVVLAGEKAIVTRDGQAAKDLQPPVVEGEKTDEGALAFTARTLMSSTVVVLDSQTGAELARFKADENGIVSGQLLPPPGTTPASIEFRADAPDGRRSEPAAAVSDGRVIVAASSNTTLPPPPVLTSATYDAPTLTLPALAPIQATSRSGAVVQFDVTATDAQDGRLPVECDAQSGATFPIGTTTVTCTATNSRGRTSVGAFKITVADKVPPTLTIPSDRIVPAVNASGAPVTFTVRASDAVDGPITPSCTARPGATFPLGRTTVTCTAEDSAGNAVQGSFVIDVRDLTAPVLRLPSTIVAVATQRGGAEVAFSASAEDAVDGSITPTCSPRSGALFGVGTTSVSCVATDKAGNTAAASFAVTVRDLEAPVLTVPDSIFAQATSKSGAVVTWAASANDAVDGIVPVTCTPRPGSVFPFGVTTVTCRATDLQGNSASRTFDVTVDDTAAPVLSLPGTVNASATGPNGASVSFSVSARDVVDGPVAVTCTPRSGSVFGLGTTSVTCRAADSRGNQASESFSVIVRDTTPPAINVPSDRAVEATGPSGATVRFDASARDAVDGPITPSCSPASGSTFALGKTTVQCSAADKAGNSASGSFEVTVVDTTPPALNLPDTINVRATSRSGAIVNYTATASDAVDTGVTAICTPRSGALFGLGSTTVNCRATDNSGNTATGSFKVNVGDTTPPVLAMPSDLTIEATSSAGAPVNFSVGAEDEVDGAIAPVCSPRAGTTFPLGTTTVTCRVTDSAGNSASGSFRVTVRDTTAPTISVPADQTVEATSEAGATVSFNAAAKDTVDGVITPICTPRSGSVFGLGSTPVTCRATDNAGNAASASFNVIVRDTTPPVLSLPANVAVEAAGPSGATVSFIATAKDAVDGAITPSCTPRSGSLFPVGSTTVTCSASDRAGNAASGSFTVLVTYATPTPTPTPRPTLTPTPTPVPPSPTPTPVPPSPTPTPVPPSPTPTPVPPSPTPTPTPVPPSPTPTPTPVPPSPTPTPTPVPPSPTPTPVPPSPTPTPVPPTPTPTPVPPTPTPTPVPPTPTPTPVPPTPTPPSSGSETPTPSSPPPNDPTPAAGGTDGAGNGSSVQVPSETPETPTPP
ncbi:MAG: HYR domain-containing protein [Anaerolineae bacterium]|nr:HYR domain-containing protein [Candidatus Roseilinea sp.]MDW8449054.1 HYR domain-containing protein [Anaerolineae bacterium]